MTRAILRGVRVEVIDCLTSRWKSQKAGSIWRARGSSLRWYAVEVTADEREEAVEESEETAEDTEDTVDMVVRVK